MRRMYCLCPGWHCDGAHPLVTDGGMQVLGGHHSPRCCCSVFCQAHYLFFCPPLCEIMIRTDYTIQHNPDIQNIFHLTLQTMSFIDFLPLTTLLMLLFPPSAILDPTSVSIHFTFGPNLRGPRILSDRDAL